MKDHPYPETIRDNFAVRVNDRQIDQVQVKQPLNFTRLHGVVVREEDCVRPETHGIAQNRPNGIERTHAGSRTSPVTHDPEMAADLPNSPPHRQI